MCSWDGLPFMIVLVRSIFVIIATSLFTVDYTTKFSRVELVPVIPIGDFVVSNAPSTGSGLLHFKDRQGSARRPFPLSFFKTLSSFWTFLKLMDCKGSSDGVRQL